MPAAFAIMPVPRSPPWPRFLSPLPEPAVRLSRNGLSSGTMPLAHGSIRQRREWRNDFRRPHLESGTSPSSPRPLPIPAASRSSPCRCCPQSPAPAGPTVVPLRFRMRWFQRSRTQTGVLGQATPGVLRSFPHPSSPEAPSLHRNYPASPVLRASPPPRRPRLTLTGSRLTRATPPAGLPVLPLSPSYPHAIANTPAEPDGARVARFPSAGSLPRILGGSASALPVSRPAQRSQVTACGFAESPNATLWHRSASVQFVTSLNRSDCYRLERQLPGGFRIR